MISHPATNSIKKFQNLIYGEKFDKQVDGIQMSPNEMANVCCDRWISSDHVHWLLDDLNISQKNSLCSHQSRVGCRGVRGSLSSRWPVKANEFVLCP